MCALLPLKITGQCSYYLYFVVVFDWTFFSVLGNSKKLMKFQKFRCQHYENMNKLSPVKCCDCFISRVTLNLSGTCWSFSCALKFILPPEDTEHRPMFFSHKLLEVLRDNRICYAERNKLCDIAVSLQTGFFNLSLARLGTQ